MKMNKWLKELDIYWEELPGNYVPVTSIAARIRRRIYKIQRFFCSKIEFLEDKSLPYNSYFEAPAFNRYNKENRSGFCEYEFYSLYWSMATYIYPRLCEFRANYANKYGTPMEFVFDEKGNEYPDDKGSKKWLDELDTMILGFKFILDEPICPEGEDPVEHGKMVYNTIQTGLNSFAKYYLDLWW